MVVPLKKQRPGKFSKPWDSPDEMNLEEVGITRPPIFSFMFFFNLSSEVRALCISEVTPVNRGFFPSAFGFHQNKKHRSAEIRDVDDSTESSRTQAAEKRPRQRASPVLLAQSFHLLASAAHIVESSEQGHIHMQIAPDRLMGTARALTP